MPLVVFLRAANVGGHQTFRPSVLAREMAKFDVVNIGAAGTLVVRGEISQSALRAELEKRLSFKTELIICPEHEILGLVKRKPFCDAAAETKDLRHYVTVMTKAPKAIPLLPIEKPDGRKWEVKLIEISGRFALSIWRRQTNGILYPNAVAEKLFNVPATTRNWNTISAIGELLTG
jgi:uncharacterized protein (DUF1697 family)